MSRKVPRYKINIPKTREWFQLIVLGDFHYGHKDCDVRSLKKMVEWLSTKDPRTHRAIITGDLTENVIPGSLGSSFELSVADPIDQENDVVDLLRPIKKMIIAMYDGNHAHRSRKASGHSPDEQIAVKLGIPHTYMGYSGYIQIEFPKQLYTIWGQHGHSNAKTMSGKIRVLTSMGQNHPDADLYVMGHIHTQIATPDRVEVIKNGRVITKKVIYGSNGSYLINPEYAKRHGWAHGGPGVLRIELNTHRRDLHCEI